MATQPMGMGRWDTGATAAQATVRGTARAADMAADMRAAVGTAAAGEGAVMGGITHTGEAREAWFSVRAVA